MMGGGHSPMFPPPATRLTIMLTVGVRVGLCEY